MFVSCFSTHQDELIDCLPCPVGHYCTDRGQTEPTGVCLAGHVCFGNALINDPVYNDNPAGNKTIVLYGDLCHAGFYCPAGTSLMIPCPIGTYRANTLGETLSDCTPCDPGQYCPFTNLTAPVGKRKTLITNSGLLID